MSFDFKVFQKELAQQKVYDTWQFVNSLQETLAFMDISGTLVEKVYTQRCVKLMAKEQEIMNDAIDAGKRTVNESDLHCTDLDIAGLKINDSLFLKKTIIEFFHYARMSVDILFQIINAAILGDSSFDMDDKYLISKVNGELGQNPNLATLKAILDNNKTNSDIFEYIQAFDNYIKHIKTVLVTAQNSFLLGQNSKFEIAEFISNGTTYSSREAIATVKSTNQYVLSFVEKVLEEVRIQLPNCVNNSKRIHNISFKFLMKELENGVRVDYISFFIDVQNNINELPSEIKVLPLIIKPNDEICYFDFRFKKIFIKKKGSDESGIIGCAEIKNGFDTNEFYRVFSVRSCGIKEYFDYIGSFAQEYPKMSINLFAMEGSTIIYKD